MELSQLNPKGKRTMKKLNKSSLRIIITFLLSFILLAIIALLFNLISLGIVNRRVSRLEHEFNRARQEIAANQEEIDFMSSDEFIEQYARNILNLRRRGETVFVGR